MRFTIVTPSFRASQWLKLCIASVADQGVNGEHIVQDAVSDDGTQDWLPQDRRVTAVIEKDSGMYDAINRGWRRASGEIIAYINADEQYLPGTLSHVSRWFEQHPEADVLFGDTVVVDAEGGYLCDRKALIPQLAHTLVSRNLSFLTAATFLRRSFVERQQLYFNTAYRIAGDAEWAARLIRSGAEMGVLGRFTSAFTDTGDNLALNPKVKKEHEALDNLAAPWMRWLRPWVVMHFRLRRMLSGAYACHPHDYAIYTRRHPAERQSFTVPNPTFRWKRPRIK